MNYNANGWADEANLLLTLVFYDQGSNSIILNKILKCRYGFTEGQINALGEEARLTGELPDLDHLYKERVRSQENDDVLCLERSDWKPAL